MKINGYDIEEAPNGAWWVRLPGTRRAWRFKTQRDALWFVGRLHAPTNDGRTSPERQRDRWGNGAA